MSYHDHSIGWACPYYQGDRKLKVFCEGGCRVDFPDRRAMADYTAAHCANVPGWERCTVAAMRNGYYERQG